MHMATIYEEDKKQVTKLDGLLSTMHNPSSQQGWHFTSATISSIEQYHQMLIRYVDIHMHSCSYRLTVLY